MWELYPHLEFDDCRKETRDAGFFEMSKRKQLLEHLIINEVKWQQVGNMTGHDKKHTREV